MENCGIYNSNYRKAFKSDHLKSVKQLETLNQYYYKKCNTIMPLSDTSIHLSSDQHKNKTKQQREAALIWCEDCGKYISDKTRQFQSEIHKAHRASHTDPHTASRTASHTASHTTLRIGQDVEVIVNEKTYIKLKVNPTGVASQNLEHHINELLNRNYFPRYKYQLSYLAKFRNIVKKKMYFTNGLNQILITITQTSMFIIH